MLAQVEGFLEVARRGNVSRAAEAMFVTQPTLTARLHAARSVRNVRDLAWPAAKYVRW